MTPRQRRRSGAGGLWAQDGLIVSDDLLPQKARILLMLALTRTRDRQALQEMFYQY